MFTVAMWLSPTTRQCKVADSRDMSELTIRDRVIPREVDHALRCLHRHWTLLRNELCDLVRSCKRSLLGL